MNPNNIVKRGSAEADENDYNNNGAKWIDITSLVEECSSSLPFSSPMLHTDAFSLQDSMAAMELLDRKMDSCEVPASQIMLKASSNSTANSESPAENDTTTLYPRPPPKALDDDFLPLPWEDLTVRDAFLVSVEALVRLESMLGGASVVESIYTCLYAHAPIIEDMKTSLDPPNETLSDKFENLLRSNSIPRGSPAQHAVYATALALVEITEILRSIILHGDIYEEEDFCANSYNITIYSNLEKGSTLSELTYALSLAKENDAQQPSEAGKALIRVLSVLLDLLNVLAIVGRVVPSAVTETMTETKEAIASATRHLDNIRNAYESLQETISTRERQILQLTFDSFVNRPLFGNSPVRKVIFLPVTESLLTLSGIVSEMDWALCDLMLKGTNLRQIRRMLDKISKAPINILTRSLIVLNLYFDEKLLGQFSLLDLIIVHMQETAGVPDDMFETRHGKIFLNRLAKPIYDHLKLRLLNRNRQRAFMEAVVIPDWSQLQGEAHIVDVHYRKEKGLDSKSPPFSSHYVLSTLVELMDLHLSIGVELSLFQNEELAIVYWYRDFIISTQLNNMAAVQKAKQSSAKDRLNNEVNSKLGRGKKRNQSKKDRNGSGQKNHDDVPFEYDLLVLDCKRNLCRGIVRFIASLHQAKYFVNKSFQFTDPEKIFNKRFEVFANIQQPPPLAYDDFLQGSDFSNVSQRDLLFATGECFKSSKALAGKISALIPKLDATYLSLSEDDLSQLSKVCIGNAVYIQKMKQLVSTNDSKPPKIEFDFDSTKEFCTITLK